jgi:carbonic anhydrase/acetyltransferase-like protein (isoleucine patch superfamily)
MIRAFRGHTPAIAPGARVDTDALVMGNVTVADGASIWPHALVRGDDAAVVVRENAVILDKAFVEAPKRTEIGPGSIVSHGALVHGSTIGRDVLVGMGAVVLDVAVADESIVAAGAVVTRDVTDRRSFVAGVPAQKRREVREDEIETTRTMCRDLFSKSRDLTADTQRDAPGSRRKVKHD